MFSALTVLINTAADFGLTMLPAAIDDGNVRSGARSVAAVLSTSPVVTTDAAMADRRRRQPGSAGKSRQTCPRMRYTAA